MATIRRDLHSVTKGLKSLIKKTERIERQLSTPAAKAKKPSVMRGNELGRRDAVTSMDAVYNVIRKSKRGVTTTQIRDKTGLDNRQIWNVINRLKSQQKIKSSRRGVYVAL